MDPERIRRRVRRFRALIIGRSNAGKTTILRCIARSADGSVDPSPGRGVHDIAKELIFSSNRRFVFHDSCGIEAGTPNQIETIQAFISERATARTLDRKLHVIWYCIPTDNTRLLVDAERQFFDKIDPNGVPVILIFTKFESQEANAFHRLRETCTVDDALSQAPQEARRKFEQDHLSDFKDRKYPPREIIYLKGMNKKDAECSEIIELTTKALNNDTLKWLLATVQEVNLRFRIEQMLKSSTFKKSLDDYRLRNQELTGLAKSIWIWFPHLLWKHHDDDGMMDDRDAMGGFVVDDIFNKEASKIAISPLVSSTNNEFIPALCFIAALTITAENSFWHTKHIFPFNLEDAAKFYLESSASTSVSQHIQAVFGNKFTEFPDVSPANHTLYENEIALPLSRIIKDNLLAHK